MKNNDILSNRVMVAFIAVICTALWGTAFPFIKIGYEQFEIATDDVPTKLVFAGTRFALAGIIVLCIGFCIKPKSMKVTKQDLMSIGIISLFQTILQYLFFYIGIMYVSGTKSAIFTSISTFAVVLFSPLFFKQDKIDLQKIGGCIIGVSGILIVNLSGESTGFTLYGDGLVILSNLCGAAGNIASKKVGQNKNPVMLTGYQLLLGGSVLMIVGLLFGGRLHTEEAMGIVNLVYLAAMAGTAFMLWTMLLLHNNVSNVCVYNLLTPVFGTLWSGIFLRENVFTFINLLSLLLVAGGIFLVNFNTSKKYNS